MPIGETHHKQKAKNILLLIILLGIVGLFFAITLIRFKSGA